MGCIVGGAIGDALGTAFEGRPLDPNADVWEDRDWRLSDDTQLTLATCEAIADSGRVDPAGIAAAFLRWFRARRLTGLGASTLKALRDLEAGAHWALAGRRGERAAGNGAAMRAAPLAFVVDSQTESGRRLIRDVSRITHHSDEAYVGALAVVLAVRASFDGHPNWEEFLGAELAARLPETSVRERLAAYAILSSPICLRGVAARYGASGFVVESVPFAIVAARQVSHVGFAGMLERVVLAGGDTDTNASVAGQIAGAKLGFSGLPAELVARLPQADLVRRIAGRFADVALGE